MSGRPCPAAVLPELGALADVVERCLRKRKEERFGSAAELLSALEPLCDGAKPATQMMATSGKNLAGGISCRSPPPRFVLITGTRNGKSADVDTGGLSGDGSVTSHAGNASVNGTTAAAAKMAAASTQWRNAADRPPRSAFSASPVRRMMDDRIARSPRSLIVIHP